MIKYYMLDALEKWSVQSLVDAYPEWRATRYYVALGNRIIQRRISYRFDKRLILTKHPTILDRIKAGFSYARYMTLQGNQALIDATADALFVHCYFLEKYDALAFATTVHYPRYLKALWKQAWEDITSLVFHRTDSGTSTYLLMAITLEVFFHDQIGDWIQTEDVDLAPATEEELSQI
jgi:hypothetical protein